MAASSQKIITAINAHGWVGAAHEAAAQRCSLLLFFELL
jgi:hypothetical protein